LARTNELSPGQYNPGASEPLAALAWVMALCSSIILNKEYRQFQYGGGNNMATTYVPVSNAPLLGQDGNYQANPFVTYQSPQPTIVTYQSQQPNQYSQPYVAYPPNQSYVSR
jgi:hypothetical protein